ncbi:MAG: hypothetical protein HZA49_04915 [Planctomycetes bacterium]|nr:hypothetical protein [Planctomycetota bacterium]
MNIKIVLLVLTIVWTVGSCTNNSFVPHDTIEAELKKKRDTDVIQYIQENLRPPPPNEFVQSKLAMRIITDKKVYAKGDEMKLEFRIVNLDENDIIITKFPSAKDEWRVAYRLTNNKRELVWQGSLMDVQVDIGGFIIIKKGCTYIKNIVYKDNEGPLSLVEWKPGDYVWEYWKLYSFERYNQGQKIWNGELKSEISFQIK